MAARTLVMAVVIAASLALAALVAALAAPRPREAGPESAGGPGAAQFAGRKAVWTEENGSAVRDLELYVDAEPVRPLKPRPCVYVYETPVLPLSDGAVWERWVYNVTCNGDTCTITRTVYTTIIQGSRTMEQLPRVETCVVRNGTLWELQMESGNWTFVSNRVVPPSRSCRCAYWWRRSFSRTWSPAGGSRSCTPITPPSCCRTSSGPATRGAYTTR